MRASDSSPGAMATLLQNLPTSLFLPLSNHFPLSYFEAMAGYLLKRRSEIALIPHTLS